MKFTLYPLYQITPNDIPRPLLPVLITNPQKNITTQNWGLIDTGADDCVIPAFVAEQLGHNLLKGKLIERNAAGGKVKGYLHTIEIDILGIKSDFKIDYNDKIHTVTKSLITCIPNLPIVLLGVLGFMDKFSLMIDYPKRVFILQKSKKL